MVSWMRGRSKVLLMVQKSGDHQLICILSHYLPGFNHPRWCRIFPSTVCLNISCVSVGQFWSALHKSKCRVCQVPVNYKCVDPDLGGQQKRTTGGFIYENWYHIDTYLLSLHNIYICTYVLYFQISIMYIYTYVHYIFLYLLYTYYKPTIFFWGSKFSRWVIQLERFFWGPKKWSPWGLISWSNCQGCSTWGSPALGGLEEFSNISLEHTPNPQPTSLWREFLIFRNLGMPKLCFRGMLGFSWRIDFQLDCLGEECGIPSCFELK